MKATLKGPYYMQDDVRGMIRDACLKAGSQRKWAQQHGIDHTYLSAVLNGHDRPGGKILEALGLHTVTLYGRTGYSQ